TSAQASLSDACYVKSDRSVREFVRPRDVLAPRCSPMLRRAGCIFLVAASCLSGSGCCGTYYLALRTLVIEPAEYCFRIGGHRSRDMYREWAEIALREETGCGAATMGGPDYAEGFEEGFVEYIYGGGTGEPPPVPPRKYWNVALRDSAGKD